MCIMHNIDTEHFCYGRVPLAPGTATNIITLMDSQNYHNGLQFNSLLQKLFEELQCHFTKCVEPHKATFRDLEIQIDQKMYG